MANEVLLQSTLIKDMLSSFYNKIFSFSSPSQETDYSLQPSQQAQPLNAEKSINSPTSTALFLSLNNNDMEIFEPAVRCASVDVLLKRNDNYQTLLQLAIENRNSPAYKALISNISDRNTDVVLNQEGAWFDEGEQQYVTDMTPLMVALACKEERAAILLIRAGANLGVVNSKGETAAKIAERSMPGFSITDHTPVALSKKFFDSLNQNKVRYISANLRSATVETLLMKNEAGQTLLLAALEQGNIPAIKVMLNDDYCDDIQALLDESGTWRNKEGTEQIENMTPLMCAIANGQNEIAHQMMGAGADLVPVNSNGDQALQVAIKSASDDKLIERLMQSAKASPPQLQEALKDPVNNSV